MDEDDTEDDSEDIMFHSFSSCSPRYIKFEEMKEVGCSCCQLLNIVPNKITVISQIYVRVKLNSYEGGVK